MRAFVLREALVAARRPALVTMAIVCAALLALFPAAWGVRGMPTLDGTSLYDQLFRLEWILVLLLLPWTAARIVANERADDLVMLSAITAMPPSRVLLARLLSTTAALMLVVGAALPTAVAAQQMSAVPLSRTIVDQLALILFALPASVVTVWWMQTSDNRLPGWLGSAATTVLLVLLARRAVGTMDQASLLLAVGSLPAAAILLSRADVWWRYLSERAA
jgi:hypothetical protein